MSWARNLERCVTQFAPHKALKLIACGKLTFDGRVEGNRVDQRLVALNADPDQARRIRVLLPRRDPGPSCTSLGLTSEVESLGLIAFTPKIDGFEPNPMGIVVRSCHIGETKPCETELAVTWQTGPNKTQRIQTKPSYIIQIEPGCD